MKYSQDVKICIENNIERIKCKRYNEERMNELIATIETNGYESIITIDKFFEMVALETRERWPWDPSMIILDIIRTPKCKSRLMDTIYLYNDFVGDVSRFLHSFHMNSELEQIAKLVIENKEKYPESFDVFMRCNWEKGIECYYSMFNNFPNAMFFERMEMKYQTEYDFSVARELLRSCMRYILQKPVLPKAEVKFWNENICLMVKLLPKNEFASFLSKRYMILIKSLDVMDRSVQELVLKRLGQRKENKIFKDGYTRLIGYYIIGRVLNGEFCVENLIEKLSSQKRLVDWKEILRILKIAYEEIDSYKFDWKESLKLACDLVEECYKKDRLGFWAELLMDE